MVDCVLQDLDAPRLAVPVFYLVLLLLHMGGSLGFFCMPGTVLSVVLGCFTRFWGASCDVHVGVLFCVVCCSLVGAACPRVGGWAGWECIYIYTY